MFQSAWLAAIVALKAGMSTNATKNSGPSPAAGSGLLLNMLFCRLQPLWLAVLAVMQLAGGSGENFSPQDLILA